MSNYSDDDKAALAALLTRYTRVWRLRYMDQKAKEALDARLAEYPKQIELLRSAFQIFGVAGLSHEDWVKLRQDLGDEIYYGALRKVEIPDPSLPPPAEPIQLEQLPVLSEQNQQEFEVDAEKPSGTVRELILRRLKEVGDGLRASDLRKYIEESRGSPLHEKTVGMTLYRLSNEGAVRREGRIWFFVSPPEAETKNPGGETPGQHLLDD